MPEHKKTACDAHDTENSPSDSRKRSLSFWIGIISSIVIAYAILILVAIYHPHLSERVKFGTETGLALAVLFAVVAQVIVGRRQWQIMAGQLKEMQNALSLTRETVERDQRAYVVLQKATITRFKIGEPLEACLTFTNVGKTPAREVSIYSQFEHRSDLPDVSKATDADYPTEPSKYVFPPSGVIIENYAFGEILTQEAWAEIENTGQRYYLWGLAVYKDMFGKSRRTSFCLVQHSVLRDKAVFCSKGNDID